VSGRGQFFVSPIECIADHVGTLRHVSFFSIRERGRFLPTSSPHLVFMMFYLAFVLSVFVPSPLLGWIFLCRRCSESIFYSFLSWSETAQMVFQQSDKHILCEVFQCTERQKLLHGLNDMCENTLIFKKITLVAIRCPADYWSTTR